jgi:hypothetical protein
VLQEEREEGMSSMPTAVQDMHKAWRLTDTPSTFGKPKRWEFRFPAGCVDQPPTPRPPPPPPPFFLLLTTTSLADEGKELVAEDDACRGTALLSQHHPADEEIIAAEKGDIEEEEEVMEDGEDRMGEDRVDEDRVAAQDRVGDGKEEREEKTLEERYHEVVVEFCRQARVTQGFKWNGPREQLLESLTMNAKLQCLTDDMKKKVKAHMATPPSPAVLSVSE